ncbi:MAG: endonuclease/exonuclease/phosphatase family protein [Planctomycetaceae bacterium]|jgi:endonuclease/exonuclease/phosphatase family metal-dependent hydrolase|nr:endonuclease/exonuclease/phosphatase family protein [Planctomycetaceae bacterium]
MRRIFVTIFVSFIFVTQFHAVFAQDNKDAVTELKVMSFNIWGGGGKSIDETINVIKSTSADIVGLQEANKGAEKIIKSLSLHTCIASQSCVIVSRYPIVQTSPSKKGCKIKLDENKFVWMFNVHLPHCPYGPYQLNDIKYCGAPVLNNAKDATNTAWRTHKNEVEKTIAEIKEAQKDNCPIFLTGDFNEPSYLDWTEKAAKAGICKIPVEWPSAKAFIEQTNLKDSYRTKYPDEVKSKGHTWTPLPAKREIFDRIDFLFHHGAKVEIIDVKIVGEKSDLSDIKFEKYPSDHRAVLGIFKIKN